MMNVNIREGFIHSITFRNKKSLASGFTLIELLVVVGILAVLSGIVWSQVTNALFKGKDTSIKGGLDSLQKEAAIEFLNLGRRFSKTGTAIYSADCSTLNTANTIFANPKIQAVLTDIKNQNGGVPINCNVAANGLSYAIAVTLKTPGKWWCIDSTGAAKGTYGTGSTGYSGQYNSAGSYAIFTGAFVCS